MSKWNLSKLGNKTLREMLKIAESQGATVTMRNGGHLKVTAPNGRFVFVSQTPSDIRAFPRIKRDLKNIGIIFDERDK